MISTIRVADPENSVVPWWGSVEALQGREVIEFSEGLNILWGPNGIGKSTIVKLLARVLHAEQGGQTTVTERSVGPLNGILGSEPPKVGISVEHDGQAVIYHDPSNRIGLSGGQFDWDFFQEGIANTKAAASEGQLNIGRAYRVWDQLQGKEAWPEVQWLIKKSQVNSHWQRKLDIAEEQLKASIPRGQPTFLLDEPDRSIDLPGQARLWQGYANLSSRFQFIVATHSPWALNIEGANYIDLQPGYLDACREAVARLAPRSNT